jgi:hypothetical protein
LHHGESSMVKMFETRLTSFRWETSREGAELLLSYGIEYDHSMSHEDCQAYYLRTDDSWTKIDYTKQAKEWMKPLVKGQDTGLVEIPANWYLDDLPPHMFIKGAPNSHGFVNARDTEDLWRDHFDYFYREYDEFIFVSLHVRTFESLLTLLKAHYHPPRCFW